MIIKSSILVEVENRFGKLFVVGPKGRIERFNEQGAAKFFAMAEKIVYVVEEKKFYLYNPDTGLWTPRSHEEIRSLLDLFIHEWAKESGEDALEDKRRQSVLSGMLRFLPSACGQRNFFRRTDKIFIHVANGVLELDDTGEWVLHPFSPDYRSRNRCEIPYCPGAQCPRFLSELLDNLLTFDNKDLVQKYIGQILTGKNITQSILLMTGSGGSGKGTLANIAEGLIGDANVTQIRPEQITGRFETSFFMDKTLLTGKESNTSFFSAGGMHVLKSLVGDDKLRAELKNSNQHETITGTYNVFIVGNSMPIMHFESQDDKSAWDRRLRWVMCKNYRPGNPIPNFADKLLAEEGSGILNWALDGAKAIIMSGSSRLPCSDSQRRALDYLFNASDPIGFFLSSVLVHKVGYSVTGEDLFRAYCDFAPGSGLPAYNQRHFQRDCPDAMMRLFGVALRRDIKRPDGTGKLTNRSGYVHIAFK